MYVEYQGKIAYKVEPIWPVLWAECAAIYLPPPTVLDAFNNVMWKYRSTLSTSEIFPYVLDMYRMYFPAEIDAEKTSDLRHLKNQYL